MQTRYVASSPSFTFHSLSIVLDLDRIELFLLYGVTGQINLCRMFIGTWNVGGRIPHGGLDLNKWLINSASSPADIYVLGFQEIVPLNARNIFGIEDHSPVQKWLSLYPSTRRATNQLDAMKSHSSVPSQPVKAAATTTLWQASR